LLWRKKILWIPQLQRATSRPLLPQFKRLDWSIRSFTVFAPTDEAFAKIPKADLDALLKDKAKLAGVLTYHVVPAKVMAKDVKAGEVKTVNGKMIKITTDKGVMVNNAKVIKTDVETSNGVIHAIDTVIMP